MTEHSIFGFSKAHRWASGRCPGSVSMCVGEPDDPSVIAEEGTACHWLAEKMLTAFVKRDDHDGVSVGRSLIGSAAENGVIIDEDMFDAAYTYYLDVTSVVIDKSALRVEVKVVAPSIDSMAYGTADASYYDDQSNTLYVWDLKYGFKSVKAFENPQLVGYAQATTETFGTATLKPRMVLTIVQPRCYDGLGAVRQWETSYEEIQPIVNELRGGIVEHKNEVAECKAGTWCDDCPAGYKCPALLNSAASSIEISCKPSPVIGTPEFLTFELSLLEDASERIKQRLTAVSSYVEKLIRDGNVIPGYKMQDKLGHNKWVKSESEIFMLGELMGVNFRKPDVPVTPAEAIRRLKAKGLDESVIKPYYSRPNIGVKLVKDDLSRARQIFSRNEEQNND